jgi:hypothetical protein
VAVNVRFHTERLPSDSEHLARVLDSKNGIQPFLSGSDLFLFNDLPVVWDVQIDWSSTGAPVDGHNASGTEISAIDRDPYGADDSRRDCRCV